MIQLLPPLDTILDRMEAVEGEIKGLKKKIKEQQKDIDRLVKFLEGPE